MISNVLTQLEISQLTTSCLLYDPRRSTKKDRYCKVLLDYNVYPILFSQRLLVILSQMNTQFAWQYEGTQILDSFFSSQQSIRPIHLMVLFYQDFSVIYLKIKHGIFALLMPCEI